MHSISPTDKQWFKRSFLRSFQIILFLSFNFLLGTSHALDFSALKPYGGLEYVQRSLAFKEGYGKGDFNKRLPQANVFLGIQINDYLGVEAGYLFSSAVTRKSVSTSTMLGVVQASGGYIVSKNKINLTGPQMNLVGHLPFGISGFSAIGSIGVSWLTLKAKFKMLGDDVNPILSPLEVMEQQRNFYLKKVVPKLMFGFGYQFTDCIGARILMGYERTSQFKNISPKEQSPLRIFLKNNTLCSFGLTVKF